MGYLIHEVKFTIDDRSEVYQHYLKKANNDDVRCEIFIEQALNDIMYELLEKNIANEKPTWIPRDAWEFGCEYDCPYCGASIDVPRGRILPHKCEKCGKEIGVK